MSEAREELTKAWNDGFKAGLASRQTPVEQFRQRVQERIKMYEENFGFTGKTTIDDQIAQDHPEEFGRYWECRWFLDQVLGEVTK